MVPGVVEAGLGLVNSAEPGRLRRCLFSPPPPLAAVSSSPSSALPSSLHPLGPEPLLRLLLQRLAVLLQRAGSGRRGAGRGRGRGRARGGGGRGGGDRRGQPRRGRHLFFFSLFYSSHAISRLWSFAGASSAPSRRSPRPERRRRRPRRTAGRRGRGRWRRRGAWRARWWPEGVSLKGFLKRKRVEVGEEKKSMETTRLALKCGLPSTSRPIRFPAIPVPDPLRLHHYSRRPGRQRQRPG